MNRVKRLCTVVKQHNLVVNVICWQPKLQTHRQAAGTSHAGYYIFEFAINQNDGGSQML